MIQQGLRGPSILLLINDGSLQSIKRSHSVIVDSILSLLNQSNIEYSIHQPDPQSRFVHLHKPAAQGGCIIEAKPRPAPRRYRWNSYFPFQPLILLNPPLAPSHPTIQHPAISMSVSGATISVKPHATSQPRMTKSANSSKCTTRTSGTKTPSRTGEVRVWYTAR